MIKRFGKLGVMAVVGALLVFCCAMTTAFAGVRSPEDRDKETGVPEVKLVINTAAKSLAVYQHGVKTRLYLLGLGKYSTQTPIGYYDIDEKEVNPVWINPKTKAQIPSGPENPLGYRWMRFYGAYGIHGTNVESSVGHYVSNGCIRMREKDVEELFEIVKLGTPVEIFYNRVVIEKTPADDVVYYIYPDSYEKQPLDVKTVNRWLQGYGVDTFESNENIAKKIASSDGQPTFIAKAYEFFLNGNPLKRQVVAKDNVYYVPVIPLAEALKLPLGYDKEAGMVFYGNKRVKAYMFKDVLYVDSKDVNMLYPVTGGMYGKTFALATVK